MLTPDDNAKQGSKCSAQEMLMLEPEKIEMYQYFYGDELRIPKSKKCLSPDTLQSKLQRMILNYLEVGHTDAAMDVMEMAIASKREPPQFLVVVLIGIILNPQTLQKKLHHFRSCQRARRLLLHLLENFGSAVFSGVLDMFRVHGGQKKKAENYGSEEDDEVQLPECGLQDFNDFWDLVSGCLKTKGQVDIATKCRQIVLDVIVRAFEYDMKERIVRNSEPDECLFLRTLRKDSYGCRTQLDRYLDILFLAFDSRARKAEEKCCAPNAYNMEGIAIAGRLLNMLVILSYYDNLVTTSSLIEQTYRRFASLSADDTANLLQIIRCTTFVYALCDLALSDVDCSCVEERYKHLRHTRGHAFRVDRVTHYAMRTRPLQVRSVEDVFRHVLLVVWAYMSLASESSLHCEYRYKDAFDQVKTINRTFSSMPERQLGLQLQGKAAVPGWRQHVRSMIDEVYARGSASDDGRQTEQRIWWAIELADISLETFR
ncbi:hypothetical protein DFQ30_004705 [Apophysomyces sp. BC1015]|nr:hypothetical protein DFQ30_004705 [Apophysomyces sp. BC1015]